MTAQVNLDLIWAGTGGVTDPGDIKYQTGWESEIPTFQNFNFVLQNHSKNLLKLAESGEFDWQAEINYTIGGTAFSGGIRYVCILDHINELPALDDGTYWAKGDLFGSGSINVSQGVTIRSVNLRPPGNLWDSQDLTLQNRNSIIYMGSSSVSVNNWLFANVAGVLRVVDLGQAGETLPDSRDISDADPASYALYHEGNKPVQADVAGTIPEAPMDGQAYARKNGAWVVVTTTVVSDEPPPPVVGDGAGWFNLADAQMYVDTDDGDSSQWTPANPPLIPA